MTHNRDRFDHYFDRVRLNRFRGRQLASAMQLPDDPTLVPGRVLSDLLHWVIDLDSQAFASGDHEAFEQVCALLACLRLQAPEAYEWKHGARFNSPMLSASLADDGETILAYPISSIAENKAETEAIRREGAALGYTFAADEDETPA